MKSVRLEQPVLVLPMGPEEKLRSNDFVVLIMGPTGAGKSAFIEGLASNDLHISSGGTIGKTNKLALFKLTDPATGQRVILVDTPGTADLHTSENKVVKDIGKWTKKHIAKLDESSRMQNPIRPVFVQPIMNPRAARSHVVGINIFKSLSGKDIALATTILSSMWDQLMDAPDSIQRGLARQKELEEKVWVEFIHEGALFKKYLNTFQSASALLEIITRPIQSTDPILLNLQKEVISQNINMKETQLGRLVDGALTERLTNLEQANIALKNDLASKSTRNDEELRQALKQEYRGVKKDLQTMRKEKQTLDKANRDGGCLGIRLHFPVAKSHS